MPNFQMTDLLHVRLAEGAEPDARAHDTDLRRFYAAVSAVRYEHPLNSVRDPKTEAAGYLPAFVDAFQDILFREGRIPAPEEYVERHLSDYGDGGDYVFHCGTDYPTDAVVGRARRTYPSLLREYHLLLLCANSPRFVNVFYDTRLDKKGIDMSFLYRDTHFFLRVYLQSRASRHWAGEKGRYQAYAGKNVVGFGFSLAEMPRKGEIALFGPEHYRQLLQTLDQTLHAASQAVPGR